MVVASIIGFISVLVHMHLMNHLVGYDRVLMLGVALLVVDVLLGVVDLRMVVYLSVPVDVLPVLLVQVGDLSLEM